MDPAPKIKDGTPIGELIARRELERLAPTDADLAKAAEQADAGNRLAFSMLFDGLGPDPEPDPIAAEIDEFTAKLIGREFIDARDSIMGAARVLPLRGHGDIHERLDDLVNEISHIGAIVAERKSA